MLADHLQALEPAREGKYAVLQVPRRGRVEIRPFVREQGFAFRTGCAYYEITKAETISRTKRIVLWERAGAGTFRELPPCEAARVGFSGTATAVGGVLSHNMPRAGAGVYSRLGESHPFGRAGA